MDNPLLKEPLQLKHVKPRLLGHWGTTPGQNFIYVHLNRVIKEYDLNRQSLPPRELTLCPSPAARPTRAHSRRGRSR